MKWMPWRDARRPIAVGLALQAVAVALFRFGATLEFSSAHHSSTCCEQLAVLWILVGAWLWFGWNVGAWLRRHGMPAHDLWPRALPWLALFLILSVVDALGALLLLVDRQAGWVSLGTVTPVQRTAAFDIVARWMGIAACGVLVTLCWTMPLAMLGAWLRCPRRKLRA